MDKNKVYEFLKLLEEEEIFGLCQETPEEQRKLLKYALANHLVYENPRFQYRLAKDGYKVIEAM